ncbi:T9SS type A sorting domain-containing protein [candidate division KSB1 bacterium]|nr:T9SS type A sorting domain-containing protein [candidate division KSB1 bacterium]
MNRKTFLLTATILFLTLCNVQETRACSCWPPPPPAQAFAEAEAVFMGKVVSFEFVENNRRRRAAISLSKIWKGDRGAASEIFTGADVGMCGYEFQVGETYVIYAYKDENGRLHTNICTRTAPLRSAAKDLKYLEALSFFPLAIGNVWTFSLEQQDKIIDTLRIDGKLYYRFERFRGFPNALLRLSNDAKLFMRADTTEQMWLDFGAEVEDRWPVRGPTGEIEWTAQLQSKTDTLRVPAGTFSSCYRFYFKFAGADNDWIEWYAPDVGPVKRELLGFAHLEYPLQHAIINGKELPTSVSEKDADGVIRAFALAQSYPNPFVPIGNSTIAIRYHLAEAVAVTLRIYDVLGREIQTLIERREPAGDRLVTWDGLDARGNKVPSGIYFYRLQVGKQVEARKLVLIE